MVESGIERILRRKAIEHGGVALKWQGERGVPDRIVLLPGARVVFVETKTLVGKKSERQKFIHKKLAKLNFQVEVIRSAEEIEALFAGLEAGNPATEAAHE